MNIGLIFAGGTGSRMGVSSVPKQFLQANGQPIIIHTLRVFAECEAIDSIVIVCLEQYIETLRQQVEKYAISKINSIIPGGSTGQKSIFNGLQKIMTFANQEDIVLIHDGVRPLINADLLNRNINAVQKFGSAVSAVDAIETIAVSSDGKRVEKFINRSNAVYVRAPQSFILGDVFEAYAKADEEGLQFIDSCSLMFYYGTKPHIVATDNQNIKITTTSDFYLFKSILSAREDAQLRLE